MTTRDSLDELFSAARLRIEHDRYQIECLLDEEGEVSAFVRRVLAWATDKEKSQLLWEFAHNVFDSAWSVGFLEALNSFVRNELLDDSSFRIKWMKLQVDNNGQLVWSNTERGWALVETTKDDPDGRPTLFADPSGEGSQQVELLMEAMDILEEREAEANRQRNKIEEVLNA